MADDTKNSKLDAFTSKVVSDPSKPQDSLSLSGFLGASSGGQITQGYTVTRHSRITSILPTAVSCILSPFPKISLRSEVLTSG